MNKIKQSLNLLILAVMLMIMLSACGAKVDTDLTLNSDFSGTRAMTLKLAASDLKDNIPGGYDAIKSTTENYLPPELTSKISQNENGDVEAILTLSFSSKEDYIKSVTSLLLLDTEKSIIPEVIIDVQGSMFKQGITVKENFNSIDLLGWLAIGVINDKLTDNSRMNFFEHASTSVVFNGNSINTSKNININDIKSNVMDNIIVSTMLTGGKSANREIIFSMDRDKAEQIAGLEDFMKSLANDDIDYTRTEKKDSLNTIYDFTYQSGYGRNVFWIYTFSADNPDDMVNKTNKVLNVDNTVFDLNITSNKNNPGKSAVVEITQLNDGSYFCDYQPSYYSSPLKNIMALNKSYSLTNRDDGFKSQINTQNNTYFVTSYTNTPAAYTLNFDWVISFDRIEVDTQISPFGSIKRTIRYIVNRNNGDMTDGALVKLVSDDLGDMKFKDVSDADNYIYEISGSAPNAKKFNSMFGKYLYGNNIIIGKTETKYQLNLGNLKSGNPFSKGYFVEDNFDLYPRLGDVNAESGIIYTVNYPFSQRAGRAPTIDDSLSNNNTDIKPNESQMIFNGVSVKAISNSMGLSIMGILGVTLMLIALLLAYILISSKKEQVLEYISNNKQGSMKMLKSINVALSSPYSITEDEGVLLGVGAKTTKQEVSKYNNGEADLL